MTSTTTKALDPAGVVWETPSAWTVRTLHPTLGRRASFVGVVVAVAIAAIPAVAGIIDPELMFGAVLSSFGTPIAGLVAWRMAPTIRNGGSDEAFGRAVLMGFVTFFLAVALCSILLGISSLMGPDTTGVGGATVVAAIAGAFVIAIIGCFVASPALMITIPSALVWVFVMRRLPHRLLGSAA
jgi:hypothetical protein